MKHKVVGQVFEIPIKKVKPQHDVNINIFPVESERKISELTNSIKDCDLDRPIEIKKDYSIVCGHNRYEAAVRAGKKTINCVFKSFRSKEEELAYMIRDNFVRRQFSRAQKIEVVKNFINTFEGKVNSEMISHMFGFSYPTALSIMKEVAPENVRSIKKRSAAAQFIDSSERRHRVTLCKLSLYPLPVIEEVQKRAKRYVQEIESIKKRAKK